MTSSNEVRKAVLTYMADKNWDDEITKYQIVQNIPYSRGAVYRNVPKLIAEDNSNTLGLLKKESDRRPPVQLGCGGIRSKFTRFNYNSKR